MAEPLRYITNEHGERISVVLDLDEYRRLVPTSPPDDDLLLGLSQAELQALAQSTLGPVDQVRLDDLLSQNAETQLSPPEVAELDRLLEQVDQLNILKTRARYTLAQQQKSASPP